MSGQLKGLRAGEPQTTPCHAHGHLQHREPSEDRRLNHKGPHPSEGRWKGLQGRMGAGPPRVHTDMKLLKQSQIEQDRDQRQEGEGTSKGEGGEQSSAISESGGPHFQMPRDTS